MVVVVLPMGLAVMVLPVGAVVVVLVVLGGESGDGDERFDGGGMVLLVLVWLLMGFGWLG